jgi:hypothetical protein
MCCREEGEQQWKGKPMSTPLTEGAQVSGADSSRGDYIPTNEPPAGVETAEDEAALAAANAEDA